MNAQTIDNRKCIPNFEKDLVDFRLMRDSKVSSDSSVIHFIDGNGNHPVATLTLVLPDIEPNQKEQCIALVSGEIKAAYAGMKGSLGSQHTPDVIVVQSMSLNHPNCSEVVREYFERAREGAKDDKERYIGHLDIYVGTETPRHSRLLTEHISTKASSALLPYFPSGMYSATEFISAI